MCLCSLRNYGNDYCSSIAMRITLPRIAYHYVRVSLNKKLSVQVFHNKNNIEIIPI